MSHFVRCDRCSIESSVLGSVTLPPGWLKVFSADLCERCCEVVRDFIRFKPSDAAALPIEPIPVEALPAPEPSKGGDTLFEEYTKFSDGCPKGTIMPRTATDGDPEGQTQPASAESIPVEVSAEERSRARKAKRARLRGQSAILPDPRKPGDPSPGVQP
jgi:hypothetical protein